MMNILSTWSWPSQNWYSRSIRLETQEFRRWQKLGHSQISANMTAMKTSIFPCDICGSEDAVELPEGRLYNDGTPLHVCRSCGFVYCRERRSAQAIADNWRRRRRRRTRRSTAPRRPSSASVLRSRHELKKFETSRWPSSSHVCMASLMRCRLSFRNCIMFFESLLNCFRFKIRSINICISARRNLNIHVLKYWL